MDNPPVLLLDVCPDRMDPNHEVATLLLRLTPATCHTLLAHADAAIDRGPHHPLAPALSARDDTPTALRPRHHWPSATMPPTRVLLDADCLPSPLPVLPPGACISDSVLLVRRPPELDGDRLLSWSGFATSLPWLGTGPFGGRRTRTDEIPAALVFEALLRGLPAADIPAVVEQYAERFALSLLSAIETLAAAPPDRPNPLHPVSPSPDVLLPLLQFPDRRVRERAQLLLARLRRPAPDPTPVCAAARPAAPVQLGPAGRSR